jgi:hypothetical protein
MGHGVISGFRYKMGLGCLLLVRIKVSVENTDFQVTV